MESCCGGKVTKGSIRGFLSETGLSASAISSDFLPFRNGGYMSYSLMLRILFRKAKREITDMLSKSRGFIPCEALTYLYESNLYSKSWLLSEKEILEISEDELYSHYEFGTVSPLFGNIDCELNIGCCAVDAVNHDELQVKLCFGEQAVYPEFIKFTEKTEMERVIRMILLKKRSIELTGSCAMLNEGSIYAIRPPKGNWGMRLNLGEEQTWGKL